MHNLPVGSMDEKYLEILHFSPRFLAQRYLALQRRRQKF